MKIQHSPLIESESGHLDTFIRSLVQKFHPLQIYRFGGNKSPFNGSSCFESEMADLQIHCSLLMVTLQNTRIDHEVQDYASNHFVSGTITVLCHGKQEVLNAKNTGNRFFINVCQNKNLVYSDEHVFSAVNNTGDGLMKSTIDQRNPFVYRLPIAESLLRMAHQSLKDGEYTISVFMLHQVVEQCCILLIGTHLDYRCELHNLKRLIGLCRSFSDKPYRLLLSGDTEDKRLFNLLNDTFSLTRYNPDACIHQSDAELIFHRSASFVTLTKNMLEDNADQLAALI